MNRSLKGMLWRSPPIMNSLPSWITEMWPSRAYGMCELILIVGTSPVSSFVTVIRVSIFTVVLSKLDFVSFFCNLFTTRFLINAAYASKLGLLWRNKNVFFNFILVGDSAALKTDFSCLARSCCALCFLSFSFVYFFISSVTVGIIPNVYLLRLRSLR